ncbi:adaptor protein MecA [Levilactobacillus tujiorum]|uniref:Adapter protein MecA n=1 Tax=Levilactobacillus tujiorum TaxID=2912243 RepID=A0ABX1L6S4_9LACO|nr:adaptor protein MecA [Levilactobacillus tujiorum]MCH5465737.1 adaptor protein MecA [Levilactobacillus tujiorum]NLR12966.1 adaptor protein MecA [Lactobacillus sp. HBUAS51387]NLR30763.1 adaptor protein MecA [Levilactobacillus tujiorum]NLR31200.1 adaptor protein MecA [Levilactobacillus tujiorum]
MEMERINENTIRVVIGNDDLSERGITVLDLLGNHKQIEGFFYSILEEVDVDHQFQDNDAVTFQVLPNRNGLELFISKNADEDSATDVDITDASVDSSHPDQVSDQIKAHLLEKDGQKDIFSSYKATTSDSNDIEDYLNDEGQPTTTRVVRLHSFEDMISLARVLHLENAASNLYQYNGVYYLELIFFVNESSRESIKDELSVAYEYGDNTKVAPDVLAEHGKLIMEHSALELTRYHFLSD